LCEVENEAGRNRASAVLEVERMSFLDKFSCGVCANLSTYWKLNVYHDWTRSIVSLLTFEFSGLCCSGTDPKGFSFW
jgi:hypothetical protein